MFCDIEKNTNYKKIIKIVLHIPRAEHLSSIFHLAEPKDEVLWNIFEK